MGGCTFGNIGKGRDAREVFQDLVSEARHDHGHGGYTGTIAEKHDFVMISEPSEATKREMLQKQLEYAKNSVENEKKNLDSWKARGGSASMVEYCEKNLAQCQERVRSIEARLASTDPIPLDRSLADAYADYLIHKGDKRIDDKWGPAGCITIKAPDPIKPCGKAKALTLAQKKWGPTATVEVKTERASKANGGKKTVHASVVVKQTQTVRAHSYYGSCDKEQVVTKHVAFASGPDEKTACGLLFVEPGEFLFFGWASS